jgi:hypothetical protein
MVAVAMDPGRRKDRGQAVQELESGEAQGGTAGGIGFRQEVEDLVRPAADEVEAFESEGRPGAIPKEPFQALAVGGLDPNAGVEAESAPVIPAEHSLGVVGFQEAVADHVAKDPFSDGVLEAFQELVGEAGGFVEAEVGFWMCGTRIRVILDLLEESVHYAQMEMVVRIEAGAEAMEETHGPERSIRRCRGTGLPQRCPEGPEQDMKHGAGSSGPVMEVGAQALGNGQNPLADGHVGKDVVHQVSRCLGHALGVA